MSKNLLFCAAGIALGFFIGFFVANKMGGFGAASVSPSPASSQTTARPLRPDETELPPNHPKLEDVQSTSASAADSSEADAARETADRNAGDFNAQMNAAAALYKLSDLKSAARYLERALALRPDDPEALVSMGNTKYDDGDYTGAAAFYERALKLRPDDPDLRTDLGNTYFQRNPPDYDRAIAEYRKSVALDPRHEKTWQNIVAASIRKRDKATAREALERLAALNPQNPALASLRQGVESLP